MFYLFLIYCYGHQSSRSYMNSLLKTREVRLINSKELIINKELDTESQWHQFPPLIWIVVIAPQYAR